MSVTVATESIHGPLIKEAMKSVLCGSAVSTFKLLLNTTAHYLIINQTKHNVWHAVI